jgi:ribosomal protein L32
MGEKEVKVINPLASRCVECGKLIQSGSLCPVCTEIKKLRVIVKEQDIKIAVMQHGFAHTNVKYPKPEKALPTTK